MNNKKIETGHETETNQPVEMKKVKKVVVNRLSTRTGIKALGGSVSNNSCHGAICYTN